jgi:hypothetical protein
MGWSLSCADARCLTGGRAVYVALATEPLLGSAVLPFGHGAEGSTVFLPIRADRFFFAMDRDGRLEKAQPCASRNDVE